MFMEVIAIFDIGKYSQKFLLFDPWFNVIHSEEKIYGEVSVDDGFDREGVEAIEAWMRSCLATVIKSEKFIIKGLNFTACEGSMEQFSHKTILDATGAGYDIKTGSGIPQASAALVPYLKGTKEQFILISTGTWCIFLNPFNAGPLTAEQLRNDTSCYMSVNQQQVKLSRFFLGHIHDKNVERLNEYFGIQDELYKTIKISDLKIWKLFANKQGRVFFRKGIPDDYVDNEVKMSQFLTFADAYHQMMFDLVDICMESLRLILPADDKTEVVYVTGGFSRNDTFVRLLAARLPDKRVFASEINDAPALGAAMAIYESAFGKEIPAVYLGLKAVFSNR
jgi:sugar (pentulose or hexulose) kinase